MLNKQYFKEVVESILNQTFQQYEAIFVDDGSMDSCGKMCDEFTEKDSRFRVIHVVLIC